MQTSASQIDLKGGPYIGGGAVQPGGVTEQALQLGRRRAGAVQPVAPPSRARRHPAGGLSSRRRSAGRAATGGAGPGFGAQTGEQRAPALRLGRFELGAAGVESFGVEDRAFTRGVGFAHVDPVLTQTRGEVGEHFVKARAGEGARRSVEVAAGREVRAAGFERFRVLRARYALGQLRSAAEEAAGAGGARREGDALL